MSKRVTLDWIRKYSNIHRSASYQDKLNHLFTEKNPYYLLEWLLFPAEESIVQDLNASVRSPGIAKNSYVPLFEVIFDQLLYEALLCWEQPERLKRELLLTAMHDLKKVYGAEHYEMAVIQALAGLTESLAQYRRFQQVLNKEMERLESEYQVQITELHKDVTSVSDEEQMEQQLRSARELYERKQEEAPRKLLIKRFSAHPLVAFIYYKGWSHPEERLQELMEPLQHPVEPEFIKYIESEFESKITYLDLTQRFILNPEEHSLFILWMVAAASRTNLSRGWVPTAERQSWWHGWLSYLSTHDKVIESQAHYEAVYDIIGYEELMQQQLSIPDYFHNIVNVSLQHPERKQWLRDTVILRNWKLFVKLFAADPYEYTRLSWVLCLDPASLEQRLLRAGATVQDATLRAQLIPERIVERCCVVFTDALRYGVTESILVALYDYLAVHNRELFYQFLYGLKSMDEAIPLSHMEPHRIEPMFRGNQPRAKSGRKVLAQLLNQKLEVNNHQSISPQLLRWFGMMLQEDKADVITRWLERVAATDWPYSVAKLLGEELHIQWIGAPDLKQSDIDMHEQVKSWLTLHSEWVVFESEGRGVNMDKLRYRVLRPGALDLQTNDVIARALVRAQLNDPTEISGLLDDLMNI